ncbi:MAG: efflux RND transporter periplasmic adaptor subunit [Propionivibrio sp.]
MRRIEPFSAVPHRKSLAVGLTAIASALILAACGQSNAPAGMAPGAGAPPEVGVFTVETQTVPVTSELSGRTVANVIAEIRPQIGGIVQKRLFREGGDVKAGELLYQIDPALYQASFDSASAALAKAEANVSTTRLKAQRYQELIADKAVSQQAADDAKTALLQAEADVASAKAAVEAARINLAYTRIVSPIAGRISKSAVTQGALLTANQATPLATVQQLDPINVDVTQTSTEILQMKRAMEEGRIKGSGDGQAKVKLILDNGEVYPVEGKLAFSEATVDAGTGSVTLRAVFPNPKRDLLPGMYVRAVIEQGVRENSIVVPQQGVAHDPQGNAVGMVVNAEGKVEARPLKTERAIGNQWLVSDGLQAGDKLIVEGLQKARPGAPVTAVPVGAKAAAPQAAPANATAAEKK